MQFLQIYISDIIFCLLCTTKMVFNGIEHIYPQYYMHKNIKYNCKKLFYIVYYISFFVVWKLTIWKNLPLFCGEIYKSAHFVCNRIYNIKCDIAQLFLRYNTHTISYSKTKAPSLSKKEEYYVRPRNCPATEKYFLWKKLLMLCILVKLLLYGIILEIIFLNNNEKC